MIYKYIVKMSAYNYKEDAYHIPMDELGYLLECSDFAEQDKFINSIDFQMNESKLNITEKEATRQQSFDEIMNQISQTKREKEHLQKQLQAMKQETINTYLKKFREEFYELNVENQKLRAQMNKCKKKVSDDKSERLSNRSGIKPRTSISSVIGDENKKTNTKLNRNQVSPNMLLKKKQYKFTESTAHLGRSTVQSPKNHKRRQSQLTQRKIQENGSINISFIDDKSLDFNIRQSVSKKYLNCEQQKNIFVNLLQDLLIQQKMSQNQRYGDFEIQSTNNQINQKGKQEVKFINVIQNDIKETNEKLKILSLIMIKYQKQIQGINMNIKCVEDMSGKLLFVKGKYIQMEKKCEQLSKLRKQVQVKQLSLQIKKINILQQSTEQERCIPSIEALLKIMTNNPKKIFNVKSVKLYSLYFKELKELFKFDKQEQNKRYNRIVKVKETIDNIREGRAKFNELIHIYQSRIGKMEDKIKRIKMIYQKEERK